jgi:hypothetical protein
VESKWSGRVHEPWANVAQNGAPENLLKLFREAASGEFDVASEYGQARLQHLANQMDGARIDYARRLERQAGRRGLTQVQAVLQQSSPWPSGVSRTKRRACTACRSCGTSAIAA